MYTKFIIWFVSLPDWVEVTLVALFLTAISYLGYLIFSYLYEKRSISPLVVFAAPLTITALTSLGVTYTLSRSPREYTPAGIVFGLIFGLLGFLIYILNRDRKYRIFFIHRDEIETAGTKAGRGNSLEGYP